MSSGRGETRDEEGFRTCGNVGRSRGETITQSWSRSAESRQRRGTKPHGGYADLERERLRQDWSDTLGRQREGQHAADSVKRERGGELVIRLTLGLGKKPRSGKSQGGNAVVTWLNPRPAGRICAVCSIPEGEALSERTSSKT